MNDADASAALPGGHVPSASVPEKEVGGGVISDATFPSPSGSMEEKKALTCDSRRFSPIFSRALASSCWSILPSLLSSMMLELAAVLRPRRRRSNVMAWVCMVGTRGCPYPAAIHVFRGAHVDVLVRLSTFSLPFSWSAHELNTARGTTTGGIGVDTLNKTCEGATLQS